MARGNESTGELFQFLLYYIPNKDILFIRRYRLIWQFGAEFAHSNHEKNSK